MATTTPAAPVPPIAPAAPAPAAAPVAPAAPEPLTYSTGNPFAAFSKFDGSNYFIWRRNMVTQPRAHGQWEVVDGSVVAPTDADPANPTPEEVRDLNAWNLRAARAYAEIALRLDEDYGETIAAISDPHQAWMMLESSYSSRQSGIQGNINAELTLARWDGQTPVTAHRDHMNALRNRLAGTGLTISPAQFCNHFTNSLPVEYDMVVAMHDPIPSNYSINALCERFRAIELRKELRTTKSTGTPEDPVALLAKQKGSKGGKAEGSHGKGKGDASGDKAKQPKGICWGCGKKGHYERDCRSKKTEKGGQSTGGSNANAAASGSGGKNASSDNPALSKPAGGTPLCLMEPCEMAYHTTGIKDAAQYYIDSGATGHYTNEKMHSTIMSPSRSNGPLQRPMEPPQPLARER